MLGRLIKIAVWTAGAVWTLGWLAVSVIGASTVAQDWTSSFWPALEPAATWIASTPALLVAGLLLALIATAVPKRGWLALATRLKFPVQPSNTRSVDTAPTLLPDLPIAELFRHVDRDVANNLAAVEAEILTHFLAGHLVAWGRIVDQGARRVRPGTPLAAIPKEDWRHLYFDPAFLLIDDPEERQTGNQLYPQLGYDYCDLRVFREEALRIWPTKTAVAGRRVQGR